MCCSYFRRERQVDVIVYGGNKRRKTKLERNVMTDMLVVRFGKEGVSVSQTDMMAWFAIMDLCSVIC